MHLLLDGVETTVRERKISSRLLVPEGLVTKELDLHSHHCAQDYAAVWHLVCYLTRAVACGRDKPLTNCLMSGSQALEVRV